MRCLGWLGLLVWTGCGKSETGGTLVSGTTTGVVSGNLASGTIPGGAPSTGSGTGSGTGTGTGGGSGTGTGTGSAHPCVSVATDTGQRIRVARFAEQDLVGTDFTVEAWAIVSSTNPPASTLPIAFDDPQTDVSGWRLVAVGNQGSRGLRFQLGGGTPSLPTLESSGGSVPEDRWTHLAVTFDSSSESATLFVDGSPVQTGNLGGSPAAGDASDSLLLGGGQPGRTSHLIGGLDEVRISTSIRYTGSFTPATWHAVDGDTLALWHFDEGTGTTAADSAGGHDGTLESVTWSTSCP